MTVLAELLIRHTRRHMPTRRVAVDGAYLPTTGSGAGLALLVAVVAEQVARLDEEALEPLPRLLRMAAAGELSVPSVAMRYRLQTDVHGLDVSRHRILAGSDTERPVIELDTHATAVPQLLGAVMAAASLPPTARRPAFDVINRAVRFPGRLPAGFEIRRLTDGIPAAAIPRAGIGGEAGAGFLDDWVGVSADRRWALEALGFASPITPERSEIQRRFRRLLRDAHPDHGGEHMGAADRIAELTEARELLLAWVSDGSLLAGDEEIVTR
ncbi:MAG: J domain-containing protein [Acidimicrobiia bacterium]